MAFAVAAALLAIGISSATSAGRVPVAVAPAAHQVDVAAVALTPSGAHELTALQAGDVVEATRAPVRFGQAGLVEWTLAPGSVLRVRSIGLGHTVELERGSLRAEVTPRDASEGLVEAFAVEVAGTRVAVHGTAFSVTRQEDRVVVDVDHGAIAVGPVGHVGATTGHLLIGPSRASFSLDGGRIARFLDGPKPAAVAAIAPAATEAAVPPPVAVAESPAPAPPQAVAGLRPHAAPAHPALSHDGASAASEVSSEPPRLTADLVAARLQGCFRQAYASPSTLESVTSTLAIELNPDGTVLSARFNPPLPQISACAGVALRGAFAPGTGHVDVPVSFRP
jgi:hypothetical protein